MRVQESRGNGRSATVTMSMSVDAPAFPADPRSLTLAERVRFYDRLQAVQRSWLARLQLLCEIPPAKDFPAFLLTTTAFRELAQRLGDFHRRRELPTGLADELDHFASAYCDYLRTCAGEDTFQAIARRAG
jgi:hypothetical protein